MARSRSGSQATVPMSEATKDALGVRYPVGSKDLYTEAELLQSCLSPTRPADPVSPRLQFTLASKERFMRVASPNKRNQIAHQTGPMRFQASEWEGPKRDSYLPLRIAKKNVAALEKRHREAHAGSGFDLVHLPHGLHPVEKYKYMGQSLDIRSLPRAESDDYLRKLNTHYQEQKATAYLQGIAKDLRRNRSPHKLKTSESARFSSLKTPGSPITRHRSLPVSTSITPLASPGGNKYTACYGRDSPLERHYAADVFFETIGGTTTAHKLSNYPPLMQREEMIRRTGDVRAPYNTVIVDPEECRDVRTQFSEELVLPGLYEGPRVRNSNYFALDDPPLPKERNRCSNYSAIATTPRGGRVSPKRCSHYSAVSD